VVSGPELVSEFVGESETHLRDVFAAAAAAAPAVVFLDELDAIAPARGDAGRSSNADSGGMSARIVTTLLTLLDGASDALAGVAVVAATNRPDAIDAALRRPGRFDAEVLVGIPSAKGRVAILESHLATVRHDIGQPELADVAARLHGFTGADIGALIGEASLTALRRAVRNGASGADDPLLRVLAEDLAAALRVIRPSGLRSFSVEAPPAAAWDDVAGLDDVKQRLREVVEWPEARSSELARIGAAPPRGVLLYGPPGCAKTSLARAVAARSGRNFIAASGPDIYSLWVGESEKAIASLFERARSAAPCVLFLDELDALAPAREASDASGGGGSRVTERVLAQLLTELDGGAGGLPGSAGVALLAATNRPDRVDAALLRPGRLDRLLYVPPPADAAERTAVLAVHCRNTPLALDVDLAALGRDTEGFTGAGLSALCREAALAALEEDLSVAAVAARHFTAARALVSPSPPLDPEVSAMYARLARG
jgi:SpoVK/Ycf46/Vps4 family AAA+-type ATPase